MTKRAILYGGLLGFALTVIVAARPYEWLYHVLPVKGCYFGAQMQGTVLFDAPVNAALYALCAVALVKTVSRLSR